jgi:hypothetical protein
MSFYRELRLNHLDSNYYTDIADINKFSNFISTSNGSALWSVTNLVNLAKCVYFVLKKRNSCV